MSSAQNTNKTNKSSIVGAMKLITICTISLSLLSTLTTSAQQDLKVNTKNKASFSKFINNIKDKDPHKLTPQKLSKIKNNIVESNGESQNKLTSQKLNKTRGNTLRQTIDLKDAVFPVVADPMYCNSYIWYTNYDSSYDGGRGSWGVYPNWCGRTYAQYDSYGGFEELRSWTGQWWTGNTYWSMYDQYTCHAVYATFKSVWNLEPWRPNVGYDNTKLKSCNP